MKLKKIISLVTSAAVIIAAMTAFSVNASAKDIKTYIAYGDSITTGYGLADPQNESFAEIIARKYGFSLKNYAINGEKLSELAENVQSTIQTYGEADIITVTIGGNDMMDILYRRSLNGYNNAFKAELSLTQFKSKVESGDMMALLAVLQYGLQGVASSQEYTEFLELAPTYFTSIFDAIKAKFPDAVVIIETQYNPYLWLGSAFFDSYVSEINTAIVRYNDTIKNCVKSASLNVKVADTYTAFSTSESRLANASMANLDFHPNAEGHKVIAECFSEIIGSEASLTASLFGSGSVWIFVPAAIGIVIGFVAGFAVSKKVKGKKEKVSEG